MSLFRVVFRVITIKNSQLAFVIFALTVASTASAFDEPIIKEVLIIGTKEASLKLPGSGIQIGADELKRQSYSDLNQVVSAVPGVYVREEDGFGLRPNIGIRGASSDRSQKITLMEDGVLIAPAPYSAPAAYYITNASRLYALEVLKGPSAIKSGPHTVGGAINLVTRPVPVEDLGEIDVTVGSDGYQKVAGTAGYVRSNLGFLVEGLKYGSDGFKNLDGGGDTGFTRNDVNIKIRWQPKTVVQQTLKLKLGFADEDANETYLGISDADFEITPDRRYPASQLDRFQSRHKQVHASYAVTLSEGLELGAKIYHNEFDRSWNKFDGFIDGPKVQDVLRDPDDYLSAYGILLGTRDSEVGDFSDLTIDVTDNNREFSSHGAQVDLKYPLSFTEIDHNFEFGIRYHEDDVRRRHQQRSYLMRSVSLVTDGVLRPLKADNYAHTRAIALSISDEISWSDWIFTLGVRHEDIQGLVDNKLTEKAATNHQSITAPGIGLYRQLNDMVGILAGVYVGFSPAGPGSSGAESEESTNFEYGVRYTSNVLRGELIAFRSNYDNLLGRCRASDADCNIGQEFSGGKVEVSGIELVGQGEVWLNSNWLLTSNLNYTFSKSKFKSTFFSQFSQWGLVRRGDELPYIPEHVGRFQVSLESDEWALDLALKYQHEMREEPGSGPITEGLKTDSLTTIDLAITRFLTDDLDLKMMIRNAVDNSAIVSHRPYGARPNLPRTLLAQIKYRF